MPKSDDYWTQRSERRILNAEKTAQEMLKDLKKLYQQTIDRINKEIEAFYGRYASDTGLSIADVKKLLTTDELKQFRREVEEYYKELSKYPYDPTYRERLKNAIYTTTTKDGRKLYSLRRNVSRLDYIKMQMENAIETLYARENEAFTTNLSKTYEDTYMRSVFDTQQAIGVFQPFNALNSPIIQKTVQQKWLGDNYSDRIWSDKNKLIDTLETTFSQGVALGRNPRVIARDISKATGVKYSNCERLARTEFNNIANEATREGYTQTDGLDKYMFVVTLDSRTSAICQSLSGKVFPVKDAETGVNYPPMHCYHKDTEVYTNNGWKLFEDCTSEDLFYTINPDTLEAEFMKAQELIKYKYNGKMIEFKNRSFDLCVTPEHKILLEYIGTGASGKLRFVEAQKMPVSKNRIPRGINWNGIHQNYAKLGNYDIPIELYLKFMAWWLADGSCTKIKDKNSYRIAISQTTHIELMFNTLKKLPFNVTKTEDKINIYDYSVGKDLYKYGKCDIKYIPEFIKKLTPDLIKIFLEAYSITDGYIRKNKGFKGGNFEDEITFFTTSKRLADDLGELILKAGGRPSFYLDKNKGKAVKHHNGVYLGNFDCWRINWCRRQWSYVDTLQRTEFDYNDFVYCATMPKYHTLYVRRNGKCTWCGNSNCRSTTIAYLEDMDLSKMKQIATIGNKSYYVPAGLSYSEWLDSLTEEQGKMYYSERKARQQYSSDKKQLAEYRKLATQARKQGNGDLFEGLPTRLADFQSLKYMQPEKYQIYVDNAKIARSLTKD